MADPNFVRELGQEIAADGDGAAPSLATLAAAPPEVRDRLLAMAALFDVSAGALTQDPRLEQEVVAACAGCGGQAACRRFFEEGGERGQAQAFCPNFGVYQAMSRAHRAAERAEP